MNILFLLPQIDSELYVHHGVSILSAVLKSHGHATEVEEFRELNQIGQFLSHIERFQPDILAVSAVSQQINYLSRILKPVKYKYPTLGILLGGTHAILCPQKTMEDIPEIDWLCDSEGEGPIKYIMEEGVEVLDWFWYRDGYGGIHPPSKRFYATEEYLTNLPFEDRELFPKWKQSRGKKLSDFGLKARFWIGRGCPYSCTYCCCPSLRAAFPDKKYVRYSSPERAIAEIEDVVKNWKFDTYIIDDDVFTVNKKWLLDWTVKYPNKLKYLKYECNTRFECIDEEILRALKDTGCSLIKFGLESGSEQIRKGLNRNITNEKIQDVFALVKKHGIQAHTFNIIGFPNETRRDLWKTIRLNQKIKPDRCQVSIFYPYPGTKLGEASKHLIIKQSGNYFTQSVLKLPHFTGQEIKVYAKLFRLAVYSAYNYKLAWKEVMGLFNYLKSKWSNICH